MSLGFCPPDESEDPESISGGLVRLRKGTYLHLPMRKIECHSKQQFLDDIQYMAEQLWKEVKKAGL